VVKARAGAPLNARARHLLVGLVTIFPGIAGTTVAMGSLPLARAAAQERPQSKSETVRPEIGTPLQAAQALIREKKYREALAKVHEAENVKDKTPYEVYIIDRMRGVAAAGAGDTAVAIRSFEAAIGSGRVPPPEQLTLVEGVAGLYYQAKDYPNTITWASRYLREGGTAPQMRVMLSQAYYLNREYGQAAKELSTDVQADETAGRTPSKDRLELLANCYVKQNDTPGVVTALTKLVTYYPKKSYWIDLLRYTETRPGFTPRLTLDVYRLKLAVGILDTDTQFVEMAQLALQAGFPDEAKQVLDKGFADGALGTGADADRHKRLRDLVAKNVADDEKTLLHDEPAAAAAADGTGLVNIGFAYVSRGEIDKGLELMEKGIRKGGMKYPDDTTLHLGIACLFGRRREKAVQVLKTVRGTDGAADLARLWIIHAASRS
jgi:tetratricopeptide (TPR) repeat protein